ncbi:MAG: HAMP domain-containing histidine kinase [Rhodospirillaceae bacterium]|nr:HAMP domain-containing histidine kinase [Rhodospirillaceae bacterium]
MDHALSKPAAYSSLISPADTPENLAKRYDRERMDSGIRIFTLLSWVGGAFGLIVFIVALLAGTPVTPGFVAVVTLMAGYVLLPVALRLTRQLNLITVVGILWLVVCIGVGAWAYGGYASASMQWLCAIPILSFFYLRGWRLVVVMLALALCMAIVSYHHLTADTPPPPMDAVYGISFVFLLLFLAIASYVFGAAELNARRRMVIALAETRDARLRAEAANAAKSKFLASVSHELRTPLNAIVGFSDFLRQHGRAAAQEGKVAEYANDIHFSATHLQALIDDVLDYSEVGADQDARAVAVPVNLAHVVDEALTLVRFQPGADALIIARHITPDLPPFLGDERRIKQIVVNLTVNAIKFTPAGGRVTVRVERAEDGGITLSVGDTGVGIPAEDIPDVTLPFFKARNTRDQKTPGIGLGLAITAELVRLHDGTLAIDSAVGAGTTVTCRFPAARMGRSP